MQEKSREKNEKITRLAEASVAWLAVAKWPGLPFWLRRRRVTVSGGLHAVFLTCDFGHHF